MASYRPWTWAEQIFGEHDDALYYQEFIHAGRQEVEHSRWWHMVERFTDDMHRITESFDTTEKPLDTRDRIREYGPSAGDTGSTATHGRNRGNDFS